LNQLAITDRGRKPKGFADYFSLVIATGFGAGLSPIAPGTCGSVVGVALYILVVMLKLKPDFHYALLMVLSIWISYIGVWTSTRTAQIVGVHDPGLVVVDEIAGQFITLAFLPKGAPVYLIIVGFILFRAFDIIKPHPIRDLEYLYSGLGIMADDILAGLFAGVLVFLINLAVTGAGS
jgi:phosphatidylglycerophosphatase A